MKIRTIEQTFISASASFAESQVVILGCPFDGTASFRPGARFGPSAIRRASWGIETYSPYLERDLGELKIHDVGDLELPLGEKKLALDLVRKAVRQILTAGKFPIVLGGDHLVTLPVMEEIDRFYTNPCLLHLDAHADLREDYLGETHSHSTVMRKVIERLSNVRLFQMGMRSGTEEEFRLAKKLRSPVSLEASSLRSVVKRIGKQPVYLSLDLDVIDPGLLSGVGTPEPGGLTFRELIALLKQLQPLRVIGFDLVELTPDYDPTQISSVTASVILREMILAFCHSTEKRKAPGIVPRLGR
jgi:agmatinase